MSITLVACRKKKKQIMQFLNKKYITNPYLEKINKIEKSKTSVLLENNQPLPQCPAKRINTDKVI